MRESKSPISPKNRRCEAGENYIHLALNMLADNDLPSLHDIERVGVARLAKYITARAEIFVETKSAAKVDKAGGSRS